MIAFIEGRLEAATPVSAVLNAKGVGYLLHIPVTTAEKLPAEGETVRLFAHAVYREDAQALYGFATPEERDFFSLVIDKVSGVGPKVAIGMLSKMAYPALVNAIQSGDAAQLAKTPGIGRKTAERVVVELRDKLAAFAQAAAGAAPGAAAAPAARSPKDAAEEAIQALEALGYRKAEAGKRVAQALERAPAASTEDLVKAALA